MDNSILQELISTDDSAEKAAIIAESVFNDLPEKAALAARRCVILHWFDLPLLEALLRDISLIEGESKKIYDQIVSLPFIEHLDWGLVYHDLTREGLLKRYAKSRIELLRNAASLAALAYTALGEDEATAAEAFFCYTIAGDSESAVELLDKLLQHAVSRKDWLYVSSLVHLQDEAEQLPFVQPLSLSDWHWILRGLVHKEQGKLEAAIDDYSKAITINPQDAIAYISRGATYFQRQDYEKALANFTSALELDPNNAFAHRNKGDTLYHLKRYKEALAAYDCAIRLAHNDANAYRGRGDAFQALGRSQAARDAYERAIHLAPKNAAAHKGRGDALQALGRVKKARYAYQRAEEIEQAFAINPPFAIVSRS